MSHRGFQLTLVYSLVIRLLFRESGVSPNGTQKNIKHCARRVACSRMVSTVTTMETTGRSISGSKYKKRIVVYQLATKWKYKNKIKTKRKLWRKPSIYMIGICVYICTYVYIDIYIWFFLSGISFYTNSCTNINGFISILSAFASDSSGQLDVLWHDSDPFSVNSAKVSVFK